MIKFAKNLFGSKNEASNQEYIASPLEGEIIPITEVPDPVFSQKMMGDGFAIVPCSGVVVSPVDGVVTTIFHTKHAIALTANNGREILVHFGLDTVKLKGEGFDIKVKEGDMVKIGDRLLIVDVESINSKVLSIISPVVFPSLKDNETIILEKEGKVSLGEKDIASIRK
jgi:PTS system D-glucosamine-specific IIC component